MADKPDILALFSALPMEEKRQALEAMQAAYSGDVERRRAELLSELEALGGGRVAAPAPRQRAPKADADGRGAVKAQYRSPDGEEWSGRGRSPRWLVAQLAAGRTKEDFKIAD